MKTIASIGIKLIEAVKRLHLEYSITHKDLSGPNLATKADDSTQLVILDYGIARESPYGRRQDFCDATIALVDLWRGEEEISVWNGSGNVNSLYQFRGTPAQLNDVRELACGESFSAPEPAEYDDLIRILHEILTTEGEVYQGRIIW